MVDGCYAVLFRGPAQWRDEVEVWLSAELLAQLLNSREKSACRKQITYGGVLTSNAGSARSRQGLNIRVLEYISECL
jgi:hypothetical protein